MDDPKKPKFNFDHLPRTEVSAPPARPAPEPEPPAREAEEPELHARKGDPKTSHDSMEKMDLARVQTAMNVYRQLLVDKGAMAAFEIHPLFEEAYPFPHSHHLYQQARSSLRDQGLVRTTGEKRINPQTNREQEVWEACNIDKPQLERCPTCGHLKRSKKPKEVRDVAEDTDA